MLIRNSTKYLIACGIMLLAAFIQCYKTVHDLHWANEPDFDRDIAYIRTTLNGLYGTDPNYTGQYMWYNPMLFLSEALIVKLTGLPINVVVARVGAFLNLLSPIAFFIMLVKLFDFRVATASLLSFLFLVSGNLPCWGAATYSPWLISDTFVQFLFYINIIFCYKAFSEQKLYWFIILGAGLGITFLGHSAPAILIILIMITLQVQNVFTAIKERDFESVGRYFLQGFAAAIPFLISAAPFLYYVFGIYHFHFINRTILQCAPGIFARKETLTLLKLNVTFSLVIAAIGAVWFYRKFENPVLRRMIWNWLFISAFMYVYESAVPTIDKIYHVSLPDTIPAFHYFFYLKTLQSIFFGFGFIYLFNLLVNRLTAALNTIFSAAIYVNIFIFCVLAYALIYYPIYSNRVDFKELRQQALDKQKETEKIEVYHYISNNVPLNNVLLCEHGLSLFPVMPTGIKMVSVEVYFSNPYLSYDQRESDRNEMLSYLTTSAPASAIALFHQYNVSLVLLNNDDYAKYKHPSFTTDKVIFKNSDYTLISFGTARNAVSYNNRSTN